MYKYISYLNFVLFFEVVWSFLFFIKICLLVSQCIPSFELFYLSDWLEMVIDGWFAAREIPCNFSNFSLTKAFRTSSLRDSFSTTPRSKISHLNFLKLLLNSALTRTEITPDFVDVNVVFPDLSSVFFKIISKKLGITTY